MLPPANEPPAVAASVLGSHYGQIADDLDRLRRRVAWTFVALGAMVVFVWGFEFLAGPRGAWQYPLRLILLGAGAWLIFQPLSGIRRRTKEMESLSREFFRLSLVSRLSDNAVVLTDAEQRIEWVNDGFTKITGFRLEEVAGRVPGHVLRSPRTDPEMSRRMSQAIRRGESVRVEILNQSKAGHEYWLDIEVHPIRENGRVLGFVSTGTDISRRIDLEDRLRQSLEQAEEAHRERLHRQFALDQAAIVAETDVGGKLTFVNNKFCETTGFSAGEALGRSQELIDCGCYPRTFYLRMWARVSKGQVWRGEVQHRRKDGSTFWIDKTIVPVRGPGGQITGYTLVAFDITARKDAEARVQSLNELLAAIVDHAAFAIVAADPDGVVQSMNAAAERMFWYSASEAQGRIGLGSLIDPPGFSLGECECTLIAQNGRRFPGLVSVAAMRTPAGVLTGYVATLVDMSERKASEEALRLSEENFRELAEASPVMMWIAGTTFECEQVNARFLEFTGAPREAILGTNWRSLFHPDDLPRLAQTAGDAFARHESFEVKCRMRRADGQYRWVVNRGIPRFRNNREFTGFIGCVFDITDMHEANATLAQTKAQLEAFVRHTPAAIAMLDRQMRYIACSERWLTANGLDGQNLKCRSHYELFPDLPSHWREGFAKALGGEPIRMGEDRIERPDGSAQWLRWEAHPWYDGDEVGGIVLFTEDITVQRAAARTMRQARLEAEAMARAKSEFLANMSHEIRTPMNGILGFANLLLDSGLDADQREYAETIRASGESLLAIVNDILDFSKMEAGCLRLEEMAYDAQIAAAEVLELLAPKAAEKSIELALIWNPGAPARVVGDPTRVRQVLMNLVGNAIKFTLTGSVSVSVTALGDNLRFDVIDTGIGIPLEKQAGLFAKFAQADSSTTRRFGGTGLGLAISKELVSAMGGEIGVHSVPNQGSTFWFHLPLPKDRPEGDTIALPPSFGNPLILIAETVPAVRDGVRAIIEGYGLRAEVAADHADPLDVLREAEARGEPFDVLFVDSRLADLFLRPEWAELSSPPAIVWMSPLTRRKQGAPEHVAAVLTRPVVRPSAVLDALAKAAEWKLGSSGASDDIASLPDPQRSLIQLARVLVVEDNPVNQRLAARMLERIGCRVDVAANGREAIEFARSMPFDLIFMDCQMPEMDGFEAAAEIRRSEIDRAVRRTPIVALTANAMRGDRERCIESGMDDYISKPFRADEIQRAVGRWAASPPVP